MHIDRAPRPIPEGWRDSIYMHNDAELQWLLSVGTVRIPAYAHGQIKKVGQGLGIWSLAGARSKLSVKGTGGGTNRPGPNSRHVDSPKPSERLAMSDLTKTFSSLPFHDQQTQYCLLIHVDNICNVR